MLTFLLLFVEIYERILQLRELLQTVRVVRAQQPERGRRACCALLQLPESCDPMLYLVSLSVNV